MGKHGIKGLTDQYPTIKEMFQTIYPEHKWDLYNFVQVPQGHVKQIMENPSEQKEFVKYLEKKFNIKQTSDWYLVTSKQLREIVSIDLSTLMNIVRNIYPDINPKNIQFGSNLKLKKSQYILKSMIHELFPNQEIMEDYRHVDLDNLELDYYLPDLKLAFEYQVVIIIQFLFTYK